MRHEYIRAEDMTAEQEKELQAELEEILAQPYDVEAAEAFFFGGGVVMTTTHEISGDTYAARQWLRDCGCEWDRDASVWRASDEALGEMRRTSTAAYSRKNKKMMAGLVIDGVKQW